VLSYKLGYEPDDRVCSIAEQNKQIVHRVCCAVRAAEYPNDDDRDNYEAHDSWHPFLPSLGLIGDQPSGPAEALLSGSNSRSDVLLADQAGVAHDQDRVLEVIEILSFTDHHEQSTATRTA
jgi:hypothetical protein